MTVRDRERTGPRLVITIAMLLLAMLLAGCATTAPSPDASPQPTVLACPEPLQPYAKASLYMGGSNRNAEDGRLTEEEWARFVDEVLVAHFPDGGTIQSARGWWQRPPGSTRSGGGSGSRVLVLLHPLADRAGFAESVQRVIAEIKRRYGHRSVLWEEARVCAAF